MKSRDYKVFREGSCYHVFNRGNNKQDIFLDFQDYSVFLNRLKTLLGIGVDNLSPIRFFPSGTFSFISYVLMPNHFHFEIRQNTTVSITDLMRRLSTSYAMYFNRKYKRIGHVFQDQFKAKLVSNEEYAKYLSAYIHNNPGSLYFQFSSFTEIVGMVKNPICDRSLLLSWFNNDVTAYAEFVKSFSTHYRGEIDELFFEE